MPETADRPQTETQPAGAVTIEGFKTRKDRQDEEVLSEKVPGLTLTWADIEAMEFEGEEQEKKFIEAALYAKGQFRGAHMIFLAGKPFIHRTINRRELASLRAEVAKVAQAKSEDIPDGMDPQQYAAQLMKDRLEEEMVVACSIFPKYDRMAIREEDAGIVTSLHDSIVQASGFNQTAVPIRL